MGTRRARGRRKAPEEEKRKRQELEEIRRAEADHVRAIVRLAEEEEVRRRPRSTEDARIIGAACCGIARGDGGLRPCHGFGAATDLQDYLAEHTADLAEMVSSPTDWTSLDRVVALRVVPLRWRTSRSAATRGCRMGGKSSGQTQGRESAEGRKEPAKGARVRPSWWQEEERWAVT